MKNIPNKELSEFLGGAMFHALKRNVPFFIGYFRTTRDMMMQDGRWDKDAYARGYARASGGERPTE